MAEYKTLACVGLNGFQQARVRIMLDDISSKLTYRWKLGSPGNADLLLLADGSPEAAAASLTASGRGIRCVYMRADADTGIDTLPTDFSAEDLEFILSTAFSREPNFHSIDASRPEFFETIGDSEEAPASPEVEPNAIFDMPGELDPPDASIPEAVDLERYLRRDSSEYTLDYIVPVKLTDGVSVDPTGTQGPTERARFRESLRNPYATPGAPLSSAPPGPMHTASVTDTPGTIVKGRPLEDYIREDLLVAPCRLWMDGAEPLILDPKHREFMIIGGMPSAEPFASGMFTESQFERLTTRELEQWRVQCKPQSFLRLHWLLALRRGEGWLPRHLDPGGSFRVGRMLELDEHFEPEIRVAKVLRDWYRLHEVAAQAGVDMQLVFHCVTAFDAIGWLETRPRERRR